MILIGGITGLVYYSIWEQREKESLLKEYEEIQTGLQKKDRELRRLVLDHRRTEQQTEEKDRKMQILEQEKKNLLGQFKGLQKRLKDSSIQTPPKYVPLEDVWEQLRSECLKVGIITENKRMLEIFDRVKKAAKSDSPVLILGESGTGKELVAQAIHFLSNRKDREIVVVPTIQENLVESELFGYVKGAFTNAIMNKQGFFATANGSTIFLDEIGDMPAAIQVKLLRVLSKGEYIPVGSTRKCKTDARIVAATNRNLQEEMETGNFREDLYYRINVINIELPPLRDRKEDIEALASYFIEMYCKNKTVKNLSQRAVEALMNNDWPGNIRQLENVIERAVALTDGELITESDLELIPSNGKSSNGVSYHKIETFESDISTNADKAVPSRADQFSQPPDIDGDNVFLKVLSRNNFAISKTAKVRGKGRDATRERFKGLCLKALSENDWDITQAAKSIALNDGNQKRAEAKIKEYYDNTLKELQNYTSIEQLQLQVGKKYRNMPKKFHPYILRMYENKERVV